MRPDALREVLAGDRRPGHRLRPGGQREHRRLRSVRGADPDRPRARRLGPHRRRVRDLGRRGALAATPDAPAHAAADSWSTDAHKWLNVPYDSGLVFVRDAAAHHAAMTLGAEYYIETEGGERDNYNWTPESSRRARGFSVLAALRSLGRSGLVDLIERNCAPRAPDGRAAVGRSARADPQRRRAQPGPRPVRGGRATIPTGRPATRARARSSTRSSATGRAG